MGTVIPLPRRVKPEVVLPGAYLVRHQEATRFTGPGALSEQVTRVKRSFFNGVDRVEFTVDRGPANRSDFDAFLADLDSAVERFFQS